MSRPNCPDCDVPASWCEEHQQWECSNGNCDHVGPIDDPDEKIKLVRVNEDGSEEAPVEVEFEDLAESLGASKDDADLRAFFLREES